MLLASFLSCSAPVADNTGDFTELLLLVVAPPTFDAAVPVLCVDEEELLCPLVAEMSLLKPESFFFSFSGVAVLAEDSATGVLGVVVCEGVVSRTEAGRDDLRLLRLAGSEFIKGRGVGLGTLTHCTGIRLPSAFSCIP